MNVGTRIRTIQLINKMNTNKEFAKTIGIVNKSIEINNNKTKLIQRKEKEYKWKTNLLKN